MGAWGLTLILGLVAAAPEPLVAQELDPAEFNAAELDVPIFVGEGELAGRIAAAVDSQADAGFTGAVLVADGGKVIYAAGVGTSGPGAKSPPNTANTLFEIASLSKQFTAAALLVLQQEGKLNLDDPIAEHFKKVPEESRGITLRHLLQHTSGIPATNSTDGGTKVSRVLPLFLKGGPMREPGSRFEYWNQGYALASAAVDEVHRRGFVELSCRSLFKPAGLTSTGFTGDKPSRKQSVATGHGSGDPRSAFDHPYGQFGYQYQGMGGVVTNVWDLWRWDRILSTDKLLTDASRKAMFQPGRGDYGLGWYIREVDGETVHSHGGRVRGFLADMRRYPARDACVIVLSNLDTAPVRELADLLDATVRVLDSTWAADLFGTYSDDKGRTLEIRDQAGRVSAHLRWGQSPDAPVTRAQLRETESGGLILDDGSDEPPAVEVHRKGDTVEALIIGKMRLTRDAD
jgi:CubicO group peptidase (beta-lactamase class C family)